MTEKHFILATAGHVDHGKSTLVKALTGTDPDRLPEEKARKITIDLGFAELNLSDSDGQKFQVGIVDVPGHEDFVRNMIAGVGSIDLALLVVAADDGWMPQTEEHLQILEYLGVAHAVIALTKTDIADAEKAESEIREKLQETAFASAPVVRTALPRTTSTGSANEVAADGTAELKAALVTELSKLSSPRDIGKPRLFVDRAFSLRGIGTVVTGTLIGGTLRAGDNIFIRPDGKSARIRSLQTHGRQVDLIGPGTRTAINLPDVTIETDLKRGDVITTHEFEPTSTMDVLLTRSTRLQRALPIKSGASAYVHHGTTRVPAKIYFPEDDSLSTGQSAVAQLRLKTPLLAFVGDPLIVRDASERSTIAGGIVLNVDSVALPRHRGLLASRAVAPDDVDLAVWTEIARSKLVEPATMLERSHFSASEIAMALRRLADHGEIILTDNVGAKMLLWRELRNHAAESIDAIHKKHPERRGLELTELRSTFDSISPAVFDALLVDLCRTDFVRTGSTIARRSHRASLPAGLKASAEKIVAILTTKPFDPPGRKEVAPSPQFEEALRFLIEQGEIVELNSEIVLLRDASEQMRKVVVDFIGTNGPATASQLREKIGTSRRIAIPFLEYLDRIGVTQRAGDLRKLRETKSAPVAQP